MKKSLLLIALTMQFIIVTAQGNLGIDLLIPSLTSTQTEVAAGGTIVATTAVTNVGLSFASASTVTYYLSTDGVYDASDTYLDRAATNAFDGYGYQVIDKTITIPANTSAGDFFIIAIADGYNTLAESNETNNTAALSISVTPVQGELADLTVQDQMADPTEIDAGGEIYVVARAANNGLVAVDFSSIEYFLSQDTVLSLISDVALGSNEISNLAAGTLTTYLYTNVIIPSNTASGTWYVLCAADAGNSITESDETNNVVNIPIIVNGVAMPDLVILNPFASATTMAAGETNYIGGSVTNNGNATASSGKSYTEIFLSDDAVYNVGDVYLAQTLLTTLTAGSSQSLFQQITIPANTTAGTKYLIFVADNNTSVVESNENNNTASVQVTITATNPLPDLVILNPFASATTMAAGETNYIGGSVKNNGNATASAGKSYTEIFLSDDAVYNVGDVYLAQTLLTTLTAGSSQSLFQQITIPANTTAGTKYLIFVADNNTSVVESNENNNSAYVQVTITTGVQQADLVVINQMASPNTVAAGNSTAVSCSVNNKGTAIASSAYNYLYYYLSSDTIFNSSYDTYLNYTNVGTVNAGASYNASTNVTIPSTAVAGTQYILFIADGANYVTESNENNNVGRVQITVTAPARPDLVTVNPYASANTVAAGNSVYVTCAMKNQGESTASYPYMYYFLSTDTVYQSGDVYVNYSSVNSLTAGATSTTLSASLTIPSTTTAGNYYILYYADGYNEIAESNENNNIKYVPIAVTAAAQPDLVVINQTASPNSVSAGSTTSVSCSVQNKGGGVASSSYNYLYYYLSSDTIFNSSYDTYLNYTNVGTVNAGASYNASTNVTIPSTAVAGTQYILFIADGANYVTESNENNNVGRVQITVTAPARPDLVTVNPYASANTVSAGNSVYVTCAMKNQGESTASYPYMYYFLSTDTIYQSGDVYINYSSVNSLTAGATSTTLSASLTIPSTTTAGNYYILYYADGYNEIAESNENNNIKYVPIAVTAAAQPDLVVINQTASPNSVSAGSTTSVSCSVQNKGGGVASSSYNYLYYYLSSDTIFNSSYDTYLNYTNTGTVYAGESNYASATLTIPSSAVAGTQYILLIADGANYVLESNENNNVGRVQITVTAPGRPDLVTVNPYASANAVAAGNSVYVTCAMKNQGEGSAQNPYMYYFLSTDTVYGSGDVYLNYSYLSTLAAAATSSTLSASLTVSASTTPGQYYILYYADGYNEIAESNENNNIRYVPISVTAPALPDLVVINPYASANSVAAGTSLYVTSAVKNQGLGNAQASYTYYYLSTDTVYNSSDTYLNYTYVNAVNAGATSSTVSASLSINLSTTPGTYYILYYADGYSNITEGNENNNVKYVQITVTGAAQPDIVIGNQSATPTSVAAGQAVTATCQVKNIGTGAASSTSYIYLYLSSDTIFSTSTDTYISSSYISTIAAGTFQNYSASVTIPSNATQGKQYLFFVGDAINYISESNENNNTAYVSVTVTAPLFPDLITINPYASVNSVTSGSSVYVTCAMKNQGQGTASSPYMYYFLSTDTIYSSGDIYVGYNAAGNMNAGITSNTLSTSITVPSGTTAGQYYILYYADGYREITESNENNNIRSVALTVTAPELPDLTIQKPASSPTIVVAGSSTTVTCDVANIGLGNATSTYNYLYYYLSSDTVYQYGDVYLGYTSVGYLNAGAKYTASKSVSIQSTIPVGKWNIICVADEGNYVNEKNELNNTRAVSIIVVAPKLPDLAVTTSTVTPDSVNAGKSIAIAATVKNQGELAASSTSYVRYYLSKDTYYNAYDDTYLAESSVAALALNATANIQASLNIGVTVTKGSWYILMVTDYYGNVNEKNENNNVSFKQIEVLDPVPGDLTFTEVTLSTDTAYLGEVMSAELTHYNKGDGPAAASTVYCVLSRDTIYNSSDIFVTSQSASALNSKASQLVTIDPTIPTTILTGKWYMLFIADALLKVTETNETNNKIFKQIILLKAQKSDLTISSSSVTPDTSLAGKMIVIQATEKNIGKGPADEHYIKAYLSLDSTYSSGDILLGQSLIETLASKDSVQFTTEVTIPANTIDGNWYIVYMADAEQALTESLEKNNVSVQSLFIEKPKFPDLTVSSVSLASSVADPGAAASVTAVVKNNGDGESTYGYVQFYLSKDSIYTSGDLLLSSAQMSGIAAGKSSTVKQSVTIPAGTVTGTWYIIAVADGTIQITETDESNNSKASVIYINPPKMPDLILKSASVSADTVVIGGSVTLGVTVANSDTGTAGSSYLYYYLSRDNAYTSDDIYLTYQYVSSLTFKAEAAKTVAVGIPSSLGTGEWNILFMADAGNYISEKNEQNNSTSKTLWIKEPPKADLITSGLDITEDTVVAGNMINVSVVVDNKGAGAATQSSVKYYLSKDTLLSTSDTYLVSYGVTSLASKDTAKLVKLINVPSNLIKGQWFLLAVADADLAITESNENNNSSFTGIYIKQAPAPAKPDLIIAQKSISSGSVDVGQNLLVSTTVLNNGLGDAAASTLRYYLSLDSAWGSSDIQLGSYYLNALKAGSQSSVSPTLTIPTNVIEGVWYLIIKADAAYEVAESKESNNTTFVALTVTRPLPVDLIIVNQSINVTEASVNASVFLGCMVQNAEDGTSGKSVLHYYLSQDSLLSASDILLDIDSTKALAGGASKLQTASPRIPSVTGGDWYVLFVADAAAQVKESLENNNIVSVKIKVNGPVYSDLTIKDPAAAAYTVNSGAPVALSCQYANDGLGIADSSKLRIYLSKDATLGSTDLLLSTDTIGTLNAKEYASVSSSVTIPYTATAGTWYLIFAADALNEVDENTSENNNTAYISVTVAAPLTIDLEVVNAGSGYSAVKVGDSITISSYIRNNGTGTAAASKLFYCISSDATYNSSDLVIDTVDVASLTSGAYAYNSVTAIVPTVSAGTWYVLLIADAQQQVSESNESNNVKSIQIAVSLNTAQPDLTLSKLTLYPSAVEAGNAATAGVTVTNKGTYKAESFSTAYYLSKDTLLGTGDVYLSATLVTGVVAGGSLTFNASVAIPAGTAAGKWYILARADEALAVNESSETNNLTYAALTVTEALSTDLLIVDQSLSISSARAGEQLYAYAGVKNIGEGTAGSSALSVYLSKDTVLNYGDTYLSGSTIASVASEAISYKSLSLTLSSIADTGIYYILFISDAGNAVSEDNENNNTAYSALKILAPLPVDLIVVDAVVIPQTIEAGLAATVKTNVKNTGEGIVSSATVKYYLSDDNKPSSSDIELAVSYTSQLTGGSTLELTKSIVIPETTTAGQKYLIVLIDPNKAITETSELNNAVVVALTITPALAKDLTVASLMLNQTSVAVAEELAITTIVKNLEQGTAGASYTQYYLSKDSTVSTDDVSLGYKYIGSLSKGATVFNSVSYRIPCGTAAGSYYVIAAADAYNTVTESSETNNTKHKAITITSVAGADLSVTAPVVTPTSPEIGFSVTVVSTVKNTGSSASCPSTTKFYLSKDTVADANDVLLSSVTHSYISSLQTTAASINVVLPETLTAGSWFILAVADDAKAVAESSETNNVAHTAVTLIKPQPSDLTVQSVSLGMNQINAGTSTSVSFTVKNTGNGPAKASNVKLYLSDDSTASSDDVYLTYRYISSLTAGGTSQQSVSVNVPASSTKGTQYIIVVADADKQISESSETNNAAVVSISIDDPLLPDLQISANEIDPFIILKGESVVATSFVKNDGKAYATGSALSYYLSKDATLDTADINLGVSYVKSLAAGDSAAVQLAMTLPSSVATGMQYIIFAVDVNELVAEADESDNIQVSKLIVKTTSLPDYVVSRLEAADSVLAGNALSLDATVSNYGIGTGSVTSKVKYYLSADSLYSSADVYLGEASVNGLLKGADNMQTVSCNIPAGTAKGNWYIVFTADATSLITEDNETNNSAAIKFKVYGNVGIDEQLSHVSVKVYPNPATEFIMIDMQGESDNTTLKLHDMYGRLLYSEQYSQTNKMRVDVSSLSNGVYMLSIQNGQGVRTVPVIKH